MKTVEALTYIPGVYDPHKNEKTCFQLKFWRPHIVRLRFRRKKKVKCFQAFSWAKNTARGVRFMFRFNMYLFLAQCEQIYLFLALSHKNIYTLGDINQIFE